MINSVKITNYLNESITMELRFPERSGFLIRNIEGLGPPDADINLTDVGVIDGSFFNSARARDRMIVLTLGFLGDAETTRQKTYKYFPIKKRLEILIETDNRSCKTYGYVKANEPTIFSNSEGCDITIICPDSYLYDVGEEITNFGSVESLFEFPFSNESTTLKLINFGEISLTPVKNVVYSGDASTGAIFTIHAIGNASDPVITDVDTGKSIEIDSTVLIAITGSDIVAGDDIIISTVIGEKYARLVRNSVIYNIINAIGKYPDWFQLEKGDNIFSYSASSGLANLQLSVMALIAYEGI